MPKRPITITLSDDTDERLNAALAKRRAHLQEPATLTHAEFAAYLLGLGLAAEEARPARTMVGG